MIILARRAARPFKRGDPYGRYRSSQGASERRSCSLFASPLEELPTGERGNPCFCPLGRAFRKDMGDTVFLAVGSKHIRLASTDGNVSEIARRIRKAWGINEGKPAPRGEQFMTVALPSELTQFVAEFDALPLALRGARRREQDKWGIRDRISRYRGSGWLRRAYPNRTPHPSRVQR